MVLCGRMRVDYAGGERPALLPDGRGRRSERVALLFGEGMAAFGSLLVVVVERDPASHQYA